MGKTTIEWTDRTWSPIRYRVRTDAPAIARAKGYTSLVQIAEKMAGRVGQHCENVSPGCENCYSGTLQARCLPVNGTGLPFDRRSRDLVEPFIDGKVLLEPLKWRKPQRVFVENQSDLFGEWVSDEMIDRVFAVMAFAEQHTFQVLTKRSKRMRAYLDQPIESGRRIALGWDGETEPPKWSGVVWTHSASWPLQNVWLGVSVEDQQRKERIDDLRATPAAIRFLSLEPLLEYLGNVYLTGIDWVIVGGESGRGARPMHPIWVRSIRDQCQAAEVPFFFKQYGEWSPEQPRNWIKRSSNKYSHETFAWDRQGQPYNPVRPPDDHFPSTMVYRVGKKTAGHLLDGREWNEFPKEEAR